MSPVLTFCAVALSALAITSRAQVDRSAPIATAHVIVSTSTGPAAAAPGSRVSLHVDITPLPGMHVYAPEEKNGSPVTLTLAPSAELKAEPPKFPASEKYFFAPLKLTQLVYSNPFRITQHVTIANTPAVQKRAKAAGSTLTIKGTLRYQACDNDICYLVKSVSLSWTISLKPAER